MIPAIRFCVLASRVFPPSSGQNCLGRLSPQAIRVRGCRRTPSPPARITPQRRFTCEVLEPYLMRLLPDRKITFGILMDGAWHQQWKNCLPRINRRTSFFANLRGIPCAEDLNHGKADVSRSLTRDR